MSFCLECAECDGGYFGIAIHTDQDNVTVHLLLNYYIANLVSYRLSVFGHIASSLV